MEIKGGGITLVPIRREDTADIVRWRNTPEVRGNFFWQEELSEENHNRWLDTKVASGAVEQFVIKPDGGASIGSVFLRDIDRVNKRAEFGIFIGELSAWGKGYGTQAARLVVKYGFDSLGLETIFLRVMPGNTGAISSYKKAGFTALDAPPPYVDNIQNSSGAVFMEIKR